MNLGFLNQKIKPSYNRRITLLFVIILTFEKFLDSASLSRDFRLLFFFDK